jgi:hypothetical protein
MDDKSFRINQIMSQTTYSKDDALKKLDEFNGDYIKVIKDFMGIPEKKEQRKKTINQEIFNQLRTQLDSVTKEYIDKNPINVEQVIENFKESDERKLKMVCRDNV